MGYANASIDVGRMRMQGILMLEVGAGSQLTLPDPTSKVILPLI